MLLKPGRLTPEERTIIEQHPDFAYQMLESIEFLKPAIEIPWCHHERWDGKGYPRGLAGTQIPLSARVFAVVDVWDAVTSDATLPRRHVPRSHARALLRNGAGSHFDPMVVDLFLELEASGIIDAGLHAFGLVEAGVVAMTRSAQRLACSRVNSPLNNSRKVACAWPRCWARNPIRMTRPAPALASTTAGWPAISGPPSSQPLRQQVLLAVARDHPRARRGADVPGRTEREERRRARRHAEPEGQRRDRRRAGAANPGRRTCRRAAPRVRFVIGSFSASMASCDDASSVTSVPPPSTKALMAATPACPSPPTYSSGSEPGAVAVNQALRRDRRQDRSRRSSPRDRRAARPRPAAS